MGSRATNNNMMNIQASASQAQQMNPQPTQSHQQQGSLQLTMPLQTQQQMMPQQPPTPGGQPTQMAPFTIINNQPHQQFTPQQPNHLGMRLQITENLILTCRPDPLSVNSSFGNWWMA